MKYLILFSLLLVHACSDGGGTGGGAGLVDDTTFSGSAAGEPVSLTRITSLTSGAIDSKLSASRSSLAGAAQVGVNIYKLSYVSNDGNQGSDHFQFLRFINCPI